MTHTRSLRPATPAALVVLALLAGYRPAEAQPATLPLDSAQVPTVVVPIDSVAPSDGRRSVALLPVEVSNSDTSLSGLFGDIATRALGETGSFTLVDRQNISRILMEQSLSASGLVSDSSSIELGRLAGASCIIRIRMVSLSKGKWSGTANMTDVRTGTVLASAEEQRDGDGLETGRRILRNLAFSLAGNPTEDHLRYESERRQLAAELSVQEKRQARRWKIAFGTGLAKRQHLLLDDDIGPRRAYYASRADITEWSLPDDRFCPVVEIDAAWRASPSWWLWLRTEGLLGPGQSWRVRSSVALDTSYDAGGVASHIEGTQDILSEGVSRQDRLSISIGAEWIFLEKAPFRFSALGGVSGDWTRLASDKQDSSASEASMFLDGLWHGNQWFITQQTSTSTLTGWGVGARIGLRAEWEFTESWSLGAEAVLAVVRMGEVTGTTSGTRTDWSYSTLEPDVVRQDSSWSEPAALLLGDHLGTGEYRMVGNPDTRSKAPSGQLVTTSRATSELSDAHLTIRITRYF